MTNYDFESLWMKEWRKSAQRKIDYITRESVENLYLIYFIRIGNNFGD